MKPILYALGKAAACSIILLLFGFAAIEFFNLFMLNPFWGILWLAGVVFVFGLAFFLIDYYTEKNNNSE